MNIEIEIQAPTNHQAEIKRCMDICGAMIGLILFAPLLFLIVLILQLETPGKVFYRQARLGLGGKSFEMLKFRTMHDCTEKDFRAILSMNSANRAEYERYQKLAQDPRLTRVGRFLRRTSLDELPQLWNVLKGEMSLVGSRPFLPEQLELYGSGYSDYIKMPPGLTGLWQVSGRNLLSFQERVELDQEYFREWSLWMDIQILARTPWAVILQRGAY